MVYSRFLLFLLAQTKCPKVGEIFEGLEGFGTKFEAFSVRAGLYKG